MTLRMCPDILPKVFKKYVDDIFVMSITFKRFCELHEH